MEKESSPGRGAPSVLRKWYVGQARGRGPYKRDHFYPSECGSCPRRIYYDMLGLPYPEIDMPGWLLGHVGHHIHEGVGKDIQQAFGPVLALQEHLLEFSVEVSSYVFPIRGRLDAYLASPYNIVQDIKSMSDASYKALVHQGIRARPYFQSYLQQMELYAVGVREGLQLPVDALWILPVRRSDGDVYVADDTVFPPDSKRLEEVWSRWSQVIDAKKRSEVPERAHNSPKAMECRSFCKHKHRCWEDPSGSE